jgi:hypothetical protein
MQFSKLLPVVSLLVAELIRLASALNAKRAFIGMAYDLQGLDPALIRPGLPRPVVIRHRVSILSFNLSQYKELSCF